MNTILASIIVIVAVTLTLVALLLIVKAAITPEGTVNIDINGGKKSLDVPQGGDLMHTLADQGIFLPSACGGKANCGQCKVQVLEGGGTILPTETGFFSRKQIKGNEVYICPCNQGREHILADVRICLTTWF